MLISCRQFTNPYQIFLLYILAMQAVIRLIFVAITDPGYVLEADDEDIENTIMCSTLK